MRPQPEIRPVFQSPFPPVTVCAAAADAPYESSLAGCTGCAAGLFIPTGFPLPVAVAVAVKERRGGGEVPITGRRARRDDPRGTDGKLVHEPQNLGKAGRAAYPRWPRRRQSAARVWLENAPRTGTRAISERCLDDGPEGRQVAGNTPQSQVCYRPDPGKTENRTTEIRFVRVGEFDLLKWKQLPDLILKSRERFLKLVPVEPTGPRKY